MNKQNIKIIDIRKMEQDALSSKPPVLDDFLDTQEGGQTPTESSVESISQDGDSNDSSEEHINDSGNDDASGGALKKKLKARAKKGSSRSSSRRSSSSSGSSVSSSSTTRMLSSDPLFLVLYQYLVNNKGENIVTVLDKINNNLSKLVKILSEDD